MTADAPEKSIAVEQGIRPAVEIDRFVFVFVGLRWDGMGWDGMGWDGMGWHVPKRMFRCVTLNINLCSIVFARCKLWLGGSCVGNCIKNSIVAIKRHDPRPTPSTKNQRKKNVSNMFSYIFFFNCQTY